MQSWGANAGELTVGIQTYSYVGIYMYISQIQFYGETSVEPNIRSTPISIHGI